MGNHGGVGGGHLADHQGDDRLAWTRKLALDGLRRAVSDFLGGLVGAGRGRPGLRVEEGGSRGGDRNPGARDAWMTTEAQASAVRHEKRIREFVALLPAGLRTAGEKEIRHALRTLASRTADGVDDLELVLGTVHESWFEFSVRVHETRQLLYHAQVNQGGMRVRMIW